MTRLIIPLFLMLAVLSAPMPAHTDSLNFATVRGTVETVAPDCSICNPWVPHGCYVVIDIPDPIAVHLPAQPNGDDCNELEEGDCIQIAGSVVNLFVSGSPPPVESIQLAATSWVYAANLCAE